MKRFLLLFLAFGALAAPVFAGDAADVRPPAVAGTFYPDDAAAVTAQVDGFLAASPAPAADRAPRLLIVPHAGYKYSGRTAGKAYSLLKGRHFDTVVLIGPFHRTAFPGASVWASGSWRTPLGEVPVDAETARAITDADPSFRFETDLHAREHSLEVQLPFLQRTMKDFKIVPITLNDPSSENVAALASAVTRAIEGKNALVLISTDMSHYFTDDSARKMDAASIELLKNGDREGLRQGMASRQSEFCGAAAVLTALDILRLWGAPPIEPIDYTTSFDATGDASRVVGYGALAVYEKAAPAGFTPEQQKFLLGVARESLKSYLSGSGTFPVIKTNDASMAEPRAVFVTLKKEGKLRGCIGSLIAREPLIEAVQNMAVKSATQDARFRKVIVDELPAIEIEVSVLSPMKRIASPDEILLGRDGVIVARGPRTGIFLPQVATETGWDLEEFMGELCEQKAGLPRDAWKDPSTELYTFTVHSFAEAPAAA